jgi:hypothetical protein
VPSTKSPNQLIFVFAAYRFRPMNWTQNISKRCHQVATVEGRHRHDLFSKMIQVGFCATTLR